MNEADRQRTLDEMARNAKAARVALRDFAKFLDDDSRSKLELVIRLEEAARRQARTDAGTVRPS